MWAPVPTRGEDGRGMRGEHDEQEAQAARRADRRLGADSAPVQLARAARIRAHPPPGALRRPGRRAREETGASSGRTLRRKAVLFEAEDWESLFGSETAKRRRRPPAVRRLIVDLKAEHPGFNPNEISRVCYVRFGRLPARNVKRPHRGARPAALWAPLPALPREPRAQGRQGDRGGVARGRLEREGDLRLPPGRHLHRLPDPEAVG